MSSAPPQLPMNVQRPGRDGASRIADRKRVAGILALMDLPRFVPYAPPRLEPAEAARRLGSLREALDGRRSLRRFSTRPVPRTLLEGVIAAAGTAPSGAHKQPWTFVAVADPATKAKLRAAAEAEEKENYERRFSSEWKRDLAPFGTDFVKEHLTDAPWVVVVFEQRYALRPDGSRGLHYYVTESVGIAVGMLLAACAVAGLSTLVHTPSPMGFLSEALGRPENERAFCVIPIGYAPDDATVPELHRKALDEILVVG
jgi:iodotyrosine deiodinase